MLTRKFHIVLFVAASAVLSSCDSVEEDKLSDAMRDSIAAEAEKELSKSNKKSVRLLGKGIGKANTLYGAFKQASLEAEQREVEKISRIIEEQLAAVSSIIEAKAELSEILKDVSLADVAEYKVKKWLPDNNVKKMGVRMAEKLFSDIKWYKKRANSLYAPSHLDFQETALAALSANPDPQMQQYLVVSEYQKLKQVVDEVGIEYETKPEDFVLLAMFAASNKK